MFYVFITTICGRPICIPAGSAWRCNPDVEFYTCSIREQCFWVWKNRVKVKQNEVEHWKKLDPFLVFHFFGGSGSQRPQNKYYQIRILIFWRSYFGTHKHHTDWGTTLHTHIRWGRSLISFQRPGFRICSALLPGLGWNQNARNQIFWPNS